MWCFPNTIDHGTLSLRNILVELLLCRIHCGQTDDIYENSYHSQVGNIIKSRISEVKKNTCCLPFKFLHKWELNMEQNAQLKIK